MYVRYRIIAICMLHIVCNIAIFLDVVYNIVYDVVYKNGKNP